MVDDLNFVPNFSEIWPDALTKLPDDWSFSTPPAHDMGDVLLDPTVRIMCTHMMVFHASVVSRVIAGLETIMSRPAGEVLGGPCTLMGPI